MKKPPSLVCLPADHRLMGRDDQPMPFLVLGDKYARAVKEVAHSQPVLFPLVDAAGIDATTTTLNIAHSFTNGSNPFTAAGMITL